MAYYKVRIEVWCDWNPAESDLDDIAQSMGEGVYFKGSVNVQKEAPTKEVLGVTALSSK